MSAESWKEEFYSVNASEVPREEAVAHSLKKWQGLLPENLAKHGVSRNDKPVEVDCETCALCTHYHFYDPERPAANQESCTECPLLVVRDNCRCDRVGPRRDGSLGRSPWFEYIINNDPSEMIYWLEKAKEYEDAQASKNQEDKVKTPEQKD